MSSIPSISFTSNVRARSGQPTAKFVPTYGGSLHFTGIPVPYPYTVTNKNKDTIHNLMKNIIEEYLRIGKTSSIDLRICSTGQRNGEYVVEVYADFAYWYQTECTVELARHIERDLTDRRDIRLTDISIGSRRAYWSYLRVRAIRHKMIDVYNASYSPLPNVAIGTMEQDKVDWSSLYIPFLPENLRLNGRVLDENELSYMIDHHMGLGRVKRIDFIDRTVQVGAIAAKSAFVHFNYWYDNYDARSFRATMLSKGAIQLYGYNAFGQDECFALLQDGQLSREPQYITLKINRAPIPDAPEAETLNVHQLAVAKRALEQQVALLNETVRQLEAQLTEARTQRETDLKTIRNLETDNETLCSHLMEQGNSAICRVVSREFDMTPTPSIMELAELMV